MELISYEEFGRLRMKQFVPRDAEVIEADACEWMGGFWINEGIGLTSMSRHEDTPSETGGLEVDFSELPESAVAAIFDAIHLPLRPGMTLEEVRSVLGAPEQTHVFVADRKSYDFTVGSQYMYHVSATVHDANGLIDVVVIRKDVLSKCDA
jgi:hypothetical protein